jgi:hypothetical protein
MVSLSCIPLFQLWPYSFHAHYVFCPPCGLLIFFTRVSGNRKLNRLSWVQWWAWRNLPLHLSLPTTVHDLFWGICRIPPQQTTVGIQYGTVWHHVPNYYTFLFLHHSVFSSFCVDEQSAEDCNKSSSNFHGLNCRTWSQRHHFAPRHAWLLKSLPLGHLDNMML